MEVQERLLAMTEVLQANQLELRGSRADHRAIQGDRQQQQQPFEMTAKQR